MSTLLWSVYNPDLMHRNGMPLANHNLNGMFNTHGAAPPSSSFLPGFIPPPAVSNAQALAHLATRAVSHTEGCSSGFMRGASSYGNGQFGATGTAPQPPSGALAVQQFHQENGQRSLQQPRLPPQPRPPPPPRPLPQPRLPPPPQPRMPPPPQPRMPPPPRMPPQPRMYGNKCQFAHGSRELRTLLRHPKYKTEPCRTFHSVGICPYGTRCHFIHNQHDHQALLSGSASEEHDHQALLSGSASEEPGSANGIDTGPSGFNVEPKQMMQTASSVSSSSLPSGHSHPQQAPLLLNNPLLSSGMLLPPSYPVATLPTTYCASMAAASAAVSAAASAAAVFYQNGGGVPCTNCANHTVVIGQAMGGYMAPVAFQTHNFAAANATTFYHNQQQNLAVPMQFPMPLVGPPASILTPNAVAPTAMAAIAPGAAAATLVNPGAAAAAVVPAATAAADTTSSASIPAATAAEGPAQHFSLQLPGTQSESPDFDMLTSSLDSLLGTNNLDNLLSCSSSSSNLNDSESPRIKSSRRLPIFSRLSDPDK
ncbi:mRNA decay activator protein ZFP36L3-like [Arvicola amphibius]|uniref:mRNA decay activator protein ZFP36L3-like n=1 Tax=Arvicola amphibius TaxID=1047088 RepID=UPI001C09AC77|nr:mRNA decay activator protein ZFP36L3-like [Arvicola amphibius]